MDSFPAELSYSLHLLIGFDGVEVDHGGRLTAMSSVCAMVVVEGDPTPDASLGLRAGFLAWRISNTLEADFCVEALNEAIHKFGAPEIMNTDQGSQFTSFARTDRQKRVGTRISMDGKGRCIDNIFIERLWRSLKYECVYLHA